MDRTQLEKMRRACKDARERALVDVLYSTGCRVSELVNIKTSEVDMKSGEVEVLGKGKKRRTVYLNAAAILSIQEYMLQRDDSSPWLFVCERAPHRQLTRNQTGKVIRKIADRANINGVSPHIIRHTTATMALRAGMPAQDIQRMLGHSKLDTTMIYAETDQTEVKTEHARCVV